MHPFIVAELALGSLRDRTRNARHAGCPAASAGGATERYTADDRGVAASTQRVSASRMRICLRRAWLRRERSYGRATRRWEAWRGAGNPGWAAVTGGRRRSLTGARRISRDSLGTVKRCRKFRKHTSGDKSRVCTAPVHPFNVEAEEPSPCLKNSRLCISLSRMRRRWPRVRRSYFVEKAEQAVAAQGRARIAISGGSTPKAAFALLGDPGQPWRARMPWDEARFVVGG